MWGGGGGENIRPIRQTNRLFRWNNRSGHGVSSSCCYPPNQLRYVFLSKIGSLTSSSTVSVQDLRTHLPQWRCKSGVLTCNIHGKTKPKRRVDIQDILSCVISSDTFVEPCSSRGYSLFSCEKRSILFPRTPVNSLHQPSVVFTFLQIPPFFAYINNY